MRFDERYKIYLDITAQSTWVWNNDVDSTWIEIFPAINPFQKGLEDEELFMRQKWGIVTFKNELFNAEYLYDTIEGLALTQEIRIKIVTDNNVIRGYFGNNDCDFNDDEQVLTVTPAILDQYTDLLENAETKVDVGGGSAEYNARMNTGSSLVGVHGSHNVPLLIAATDVDELREPSTDGLPNSGGAFLANTKSPYSAQFEFTIEGTFSVAVGETFQFQFKEYDSSNTLLASSNLPVYDGSSSAISLNTTFEYEPQIEKLSYVTLECIFSDETSLASYRSTNLSIFLIGNNYSAITVDIKLLSANLVSLPVWTEVKYGIARPKYTTWESTNGVIDYFDNTTGQPLATAITGITGFFDDTELGQAAVAGSAINNGNDVVNEPIGGLNLSDLATALEDYGYEPSSVTVFKNGFYRSGFTRKRRIYATCTFSREEYLKVYDGSDPEGDGWIDTEKDINNQRLYVRKPFNGIITDWELGDIITTGGTTAGFDWQEKLTSVKSYPTGEDSRTFDTARELQEVLTTIYNGTSDLLVGKSVVSTFFFNDNESELPYYDNPENSGSDYVRGLNPNVLNRIACIHTKNFDTTDSDVTSEDRVLELSFNDIISDMKMLWPIFWFVEEDGTLHIEHIKYLDLKRITNDIRGIATIDETNKWSYDKTKMFETIEYYTANSGYVDFTNNDRTFDKIASNKRNKDIKLELKTEYLSSDIKYCIESATDLENGLALVAYDENNVMINSEVPILGQVFENGELALSNLLNRYWQYEGVWLTGKINGVTTEFTKSARTKTGKPLSLKNIVNYDVDGEEITFLTTEIGIGLIKSMKQDFDRGTTEDILLLYRFNSDPDADSFVLIAATDVLYDFGNYEN